ncbi:GNAT family N-acetyltransferase [Deinococcus sonorensis]|uniref:GNAT family N-acetyltransferase n=2 Tax=Deinococcus sonorensis TaxID=309891 RepID=A0AAU7UBX8_9DEIO
MTVRPFVRGDAEAAARVYTRGRPGNPATAATLLAEDDRQRQAGATHARWVSEREGQIVGVAEWLEPLGARRPGSVWLELAVLPEQRGRGLGAALYDTLGTAMQPLNLRVLRAVASEANPVALRFAERRGFVEEQRFWDRTLDLAAWTDDAAPLPDLQCLTLPELPAAVPNWEAQLYHVYQQARQDLPRPEGEPFTPQTLEQFRHDWLQGAPVRPQDLMVAIREGVVLGFTALEDSGEPGEQVVAMTAVARAARGQGVALALKRASIGQARRSGVQRIRTSNHSQNLPMLRVNDRLGFTREPARLGLVRHERGDL